LHTVSTSSRLRRRSRLLLAGVLAALVLRALVPVGFMPVASASGMAMELCPGHAANASGHPGRAPGSHGEPNSGSGQLCSFAASAAPPVAPAIFILPTVARTLVAAATISPASVLLLPGFRAHSPRGPPLQA
jgi:hypothetical protein